MFIFQVNVVKISNSQNAKTNKKQPAKWQKFVFDGLKYTNRLSKDVKKCKFWTV